MKKVKIKNKKKLILEGKVCVLFIGTQFSDLYTAVDAPAIAV